MGKKLFISICFMLLIVGNGHHKVFAQAEYSVKTDQITMESVNGNAEIEISGIEKNTVVKLECDNQAVAGFSYSNENLEDDIEDADALELKEGDHLQEKGKWKNTFEIVPRNAGSCKVTVSVNGEPDKTWNVTVTPTAPKVYMYPQKTMWSVDDRTFIEFSNLSKYAEATIRTDQPITLYYADESKSRINVTKKEKKLDLQKMDYRELDVNSYVKSIKSGKRKIKIKITQDGKVYQFTVKLNVKQYICPYQSFQFGGVDFTKHFKKHSAILSKEEETGGGARVAKKTAKKTQNGSTFTIKMKKGYSIYRIEYTDLEWTAGPNKHYKLEEYTVKNGVVTGKMIPNYRTMYVYYKKGNKKIWRT